MKDIPSKGVVKVEVQRSLKTPPPPPTLGRNPSFAYPFRISSDDEDIEAAKPKSPRHNVNGNRQSTSTSTPIHTGMNDEIEEELYLRRLLARRSFHLPNHNWCQDWLQFIANNHPLLGIFMHHPLHPLQLGHRILILIGSVAFGLTATNSVYLWYVYSNEDMNKILIQISLGNVPLNISDEELKITYGMLALWTFGSMLHSLFDICMWFLTACTCFLEGGACGRYSRLRSLGSYLTIAIVAVMVACSSFVVASRAIYESRLNAAEQDISIGGQIVQFESFSFLFGYGVESLLVYFVYYPLFVTIGFSGALHPCFRCFPFIRFLGGRPEEVARQLEERMNMRQRRKKLQSANKVISK